MSLARYSARRDANEVAIVEALRRVGATVTMLSTKGVPDLLVGYKGMTFLLEVKMPAGPKGGVDGRTLTDEQQEWWTAWRGSPPLLVRSATEALAAIGAVSGTNQLSASGSAREDK